MATSDSASADASQLAYLQTRLRNAQLSLARDLEDISKPQYQNSRDQAILKNTIAQQREVIADLEAQIAELQARAAQPVSSSADTTALAQAARDDSANASATTVTQKEIGSDGRVVEKTAAAPTNADVPKTTTNGNVDVGTNAETVTLTVSQGIPGGYGSGANNPSLIPVPPPAKVAIERGFAQVNAVNTGGTPGVGAQREDAAKPPTPANSVVNRLDELYAGAQNAIVSQDNILDQFGSYTYSLSWYLVDYKTFNTLISSDIKQLNNYYLLMQSGGAPVQTTSQSYVPVTSAGRSPFFPLDYYLDNFVFEGAMPGTPGAGGAAAIRTLSFTVTEPNGITLQPNLIRAVNDLYQKGGLAPAGTTVNYSEVQYVMVVRFYGYDSKGNLVIPIDQRQGVTDRQAAVEKFIPFKITDIQFKVANKLVEYNITGVPVEQDTAFSTDRGSIPQAFQFQGTTVKDILVGSIFDATNNQSAAEDNLVNRRPPAVANNAGNQSAAEERRLGIKSAPAKAPDAPKKVSGSQATGLCAALNLFYAEAARERKRIPDIYEVQFLDKMLANALITPPGAVDKAFAGGNPNANAASNLDPNRQNFSPNIRVRSVTQGQQIVQFIDEVLRSSSYISDQQKAKWQVDPKTGKYDWVFNGKTAQNFAWFNITCEAQVIGYDTTTNATAYKMIYKVAPYQVSMIATSEYFDPSSFRGVHKVYNYWFTGQNTQVLQYEQNFNYLWKQTISRNSPGQGTTIDRAVEIRDQVNSRVMYSKRFMPVSNQSREGAEGDVYEAAANAADMLYTTDLNNITLQVIGDPAWIPSPKNPQPGNFVASPFFPDGTINFNAGVPYFEFAWNRAVDYNLSTGLMDTAQNNYFADRAQGRAGVAQESVIYMALNVKSTFARGKFTQELKGAMLQDGKNVLGSAAPPASETTRVVQSANDGNAGEAVAQAGVQKISEAQKLANQYAQYRSAPTAESSGNVITGNTIEAPLPAAPIQATEVAASAPPPKLGAGGFGSGANNPSLAVTSDVPQLIAKDA